MPHDRLTLHAEADIAVMTRVLRLPTASMRQARRIVRLQLDRLSPIPPADALWDMVRLDVEGAEGVFALGLIRKGELGADQPKRLVSREVEGRVIVFQFRNAQAASLQEARLLARAPELTLTALCAALLALSLAAKAGEWRDRRLPELAQAMRDHRREVRLRQEEDQARQAWTALAKTDAALQWLCLTTRLRQDAAEPAVISSIEITAAGTALVTRDAAAPARLQAVGGEPQAAGDGSTRVAVSPEVCR